MKVSKLKLGIVGVGKMGSYHLEKFHALPEVEVVGVYDALPERSAAAAQRFPVKAWERLPELLFECDAVVISATTNAHYHLARQALEAGVHVLVEKPLTQTVEEAEELIRLAAQKQLILQVGLIERFRYLSLSKGYHLSPVRFIESHRLSPSLGRDGNIDVISDLMIHDLDLVLSLIGEDPSYLSAVGVAVITPHVDMANVRMEFPSGPVVNLSASRVSSKAVRKFRVFSWEAYASFDFVSNSVNLYHRNPKAEIEHLKLERPGLDALADQCRSFTESVTLGLPPVVSGEDGLRALRCVRLIREKIAERAGAGPRPSTDLEKRAPF